MKRYFFGAIVFLFFGINIVGQTTPHTVDMAVGNNSSAFGTNGFLGSDNGINYYLHWDTNNLYFGFDGGTTTWWSDLYTIGIDVINDDGCTEDVLGVFADNNVFDYYVVWENNGGAYGDSADGLLLFKSNSAGVSWSNIHEIRPANNNTDALISWGSPGEVRYKIAWSLLGVTPGTNQPIAFTFWMNNPNYNNAWSSFPSVNPTGSTAITMTHKLVFGSTGTGVNPSTAGSTQAMAVVLPIELVSFEASEQEEKILLNWITATERNSSHFEIEHSLDAFKFDPIGRVETVGESLILQDYSYLHRNPSSGNNYYRLAHYDLDGTLSYSDISSVFVGKEHDINIYPNPVNDIFTISSRGETNIDLVEIYDMQGSLVEQLNLCYFRNEIEVLTEAWRCGMYQVLIIHADGTTTSENLLKQ